MATPSPVAVRPRWGHRTSLFQVREPAFWVFVVLVVAGLLFTIIEQATLAEFSVSGWAVSWLLVLVYAVPLVVVIYLLDLYEREPLSLVVGALLWGAFAAIALATFANTGWASVIRETAGLRFALEWGPALTAPFVEETLKGLGIVLLYLIARREFDDVMDGFVYGAMVGLGFAVVENVFYFVARIAPAPQFEGDVLAGVFEGFFIRVLASGLYGHVLYSGLIGIAVAYVATRRDQTAAKRWGVAAGLIAVAVGGHLLWNSPLIDLTPESPLEGVEYLQWVGAAAVKGIPFLLAVIVAVTLARRREHRWLRAALADEVGKDGLRRDEAETLMDPRARRRARKEMARRAGAASGRILKGLQRAQIQLAMVRTRVDRDDHPDLVAQRRYCAALRDRLIAASRVSSM